LRRGTKSAGWAYRVGLNLDAKDNSMNVGNANIRLVDIYEAGPPVVDVMDA